MMHACIDTGASESTLTITRPKISFFTTISSAVLFTFSLPVNKRLSVFPLSPFPREAGVSLFCFVFVFCFFCAFSELKRAIYGI